MAHATRPSLAAAIKAEAQRLGFALVGICPAVTPAGLGRFHEWLDADFAGEMHYLPERRAAYADPSRVLEGVRSVVMLGMNYRTAEPIEPAAGEGRVSRYAWGGDYHDLIRDRLEALKDFAVRELPSATARGVVDTAPLLEREFAQLAGLGWIGKNTLVLNRQWGSWFFLAALLTDAELDYDAPHNADHCGTCRACLDACPTDAFVAPYVLDARRCISYLTIELRNAIPMELRSGMGQWTFGCDICQDVCPWNSRPPATTEPAFAPREEMNPLDLIELFTLDDEAFRQRFRHTPLWRAKRRGMLRNAAIALGNRPTSTALPSLIRGLGDDEPLVRGALRSGGMGKYDQSEARDALLTRAEVEEDASVRPEIQAALKRE